MSLKGEEALILSELYTDETLEGAGALKGEDGKSAYQIWLELGNTGTEEDFINSLKGEKGDNGKSAYQYAKDGGYIGTETEFTTNIARSGVISKELEVERARIDNLTTLQDGSTTGDAELIDSRIDKDGNAHVNVGEHIRTVSSQLSNEINNLTELKPLEHGLVLAEYFRTGIPITPSEQTHHYFHTSKIDVSQYKYVYITANAYYGNDMYLFYDENDNVISFQAGYGTTIANEKVIVPNGAKYLIACTNEKLDCQPMVCVEMPKVNKTIVSKTKGRKWALFGDSLSDKTNTTTVKRYYEYLADPSCEIINHAVSGSGYYQNNGATENNILSKVNALTGDEGYDIISVFAGINDSGDNFGGIGLGELGDTEDTMYGRIYNVFNALQIKFPNAFIFAITPTVTSYRHSANNEIDQIADVVKDVCRMLKIPVADVNRNCPLKPWNETHRALYYADNGEDGVHPNHNGHELIANTVRGVFDFM